MREQKYPEKTKAWPNATLFTTNPTWTGLGLNLGLCRKRPAAICLSHGMDPSALYSGTPGM